MSAITSVWTIGHSSRSWEEFAALLGAFSIEAVCDVRAWPNSRKFPWFSGDTMREALAAANVAYHWMGKHLGGHRMGGLGDESPNMALADPIFRNYADRMQDDGFRGALDGLIALVSGARTAVMCAEADYARCHRSLLSDALVARGVRVVHILGPAGSTEHRLSPEARIADGIVTYPPADDLLGWSKDA